MSEGVLPIIANTAKAYAEWSKVAALRMYRRASTLPLLPRSILVLATHLPPSTYGGVYRPLHLLRYAAQSDWKITAVCQVTEAPITAAGKYLANLLPTAVNIHRFEPANYKPSWSAFPWVDGSFVNSLRAVTLSLSRLDHRPGLIFATGPRFYSFPAAYILARSLKRPFVLDYRDEWTQCPFDFVTLGNSDLRWERHCLSQASAVIYTTESIRRHAAETFGHFLLTKSYVVPNGWDDADFHSNDERDPAISRRRIVLSFLGSFNNSSPVPFLKSLRTVLHSNSALRDQLTVAFVGPLSEAQRSICRGHDDFGNLAFHESVPKREATRIMQNSSGLLSFIGPELTRYMPQKIYEYAASGRPILLYGHTGEASTAVLQNGLGYFVREGDVSALAKAIKEIASKQSTQVPDSARLWLTLHRREVIARSFLSIFSYVANA